MQKKLTELREEKSKLKNEHEQKLNQLIKDKQYSIKKYLQEKNKYYKQILVQDQLIKSEIENLNEQTDLTNDSYKENIQLIHLSYKNKLNDIKNKFSKVNFFLIEINKFELLYRNVYISMNVLII